MTAYELEILRALNGAGGLLTRRVASKASTLNTNPRRHSAAVRVLLLKLMKQGLVEYLDDQKPVCWKLTSAGAAAIQSAPDGFRQ
jgi:hypothetical protein